MVQECNENRLNYLFTLSEIKTENFTHISNFPLFFFYKEIRCYLSECKKAIDVYNLSDVV